ncbi:fibronectin type III domain-containing protein [Niveibacterium sp. SC-1]|uniref:fibronectin type III domain-containing protein n=1 Tax=Niveibacterium sp. SC-1 TaxID=3135646 RepID=UPI00311D761C
MYAPPSLVSGGFTSASGSLSVNADWYKYGYGPQDLSFIKNTSKLAGAAIAVGYWIGGDYDYDIANGTNVSGENAGNILWENTKRMITDLKNTGRPILLRVGYEAEAPWNGHWPANYKTVWSRIKAEINAQGATNIATVWQLAAYCPATDFWGAGITPRTLVASQPIAATGANSNGVVNVSESNPGAVYDQWYPGADADWTGISIFDPEDCANGYGAIQSVVNYLKTKGKPILVAESAARGYDYNPSTGLYSYNQQGKASRPNLSATTVWNEWYAPFFQFVRTNSDWIRAVAYISDDWQKYTHWQCSVDANGNKISGCAEANWGNTRVDVNATIKANWLAQLSSDGKFITTTAQPADTTAPSVPTSLAIASKTSSSITLSWTASTDNVGVDHYDVFNSAGTQLGISTSTGYTAGSLAANTSYSFQVRACDAAGNCSAKTAVVTGTTNAASSDTTAPTVPSSLAVTGTTSSSITLGWTVSTDNVAVTRYEIFNSAGTQLGTSTTNSYTAGSLTASTTYGFQVRACDAANNCSAKTAVVSGTTQAGGGSGTNLPGVVTTTSFTGSQNFTVNVATAGNYYFVVTYSSTANSKLITTTFNGSNTNAAVNSGTGSVQTTDFNSVATGSKTLTINAESGVTVTKVEAFKR